MACSQITFRFSKNALLWRPLEEAYLVLRTTDHLGLPIALCPHHLCRLPVLNLWTQRAPFSAEWFLIASLLMRSWHLTSFLNRFRRIIALFSTMWESRTALFVPPASRVWDVLGVCPAGCYHLHVVVKCVMALRIQWVRSWRYSRGSAGMACKSPSYFRMLGWKDAFHLSSWHRALPQVFCGKGLRLSRLCHFFSSMSKLIISSR